MNLRSLTLALALAAASAAGADLFRDDFSKFPPGWLTSPVGMRRFRNTIICRIAASRSDSGKCLSRTSIPG
jgi:hypothetical protein